MAGDLDARLMDGAALSRTILEGVALRAAALAGPDASPETLALIQHVLRATNPDGFMRAARFLASDTYTPDYVARLTMPKSAVILSSLVSFAWIVLLYATPWSPAHGPRAARAT